MNRVVENQSRSNSCDVDKILRDLVEEKTKKKPIIHAFSSVVSAPDIANLLAGMGTSPIMSDAFEDISTFNFKPDCLLLNLGMPNDLKKKSYIYSYQKALSDGIPVVLDPVGAGSSEYRLSLVYELLRFGNPSIIKGNYSELNSILNGSSNEFGVGSKVFFESDDHESMEKISIVERLCEKYGSTVVLTGEEDYIAFKSDRYQQNNIIAKNPDNNIIAKKLVNKKSVNSLYNPMLVQNISGTGCLLGAFLAGYLVSKDQFCIERAVRFFKKRLLNDGKSALEIKQNLIISLCRDGEKFDED